MSLYEAVNFTDGLYKAAVRRRTLACFIARFIALVTPTPSLAFTITCCLCVSSPSVSVAVSNRYKLLVGQSVLHFYTSSYIITLSFALFTAIALIF